MPAQTTPPLIPEMPPAPSRSEGQAAFNITAGPFIAAMPPMVVNINIALTWIGQQVTAVDGYRQAAATSASNAADSASAANAAKNAAAQSATDATNNGKAQVDLAKDQVTLAQQAASVAQAAAAAAGAAAGLPSMVGKKGWVLEVTPSEMGAVWRPRHNVGDVAITAGTLDASYILTGGIYLQSAFPVLFQKIGKIPTPGVYSFQGVSNPNGYVITDLDSDGNGTWIAAVSDVTGTSTALLGYVLRSTDNGLNWTPVSISRLRNSKIRYASGIWMCVGRFYDTSRNSLYCAHSVDGGQTWSVAREITSVPGNIGSNPPYLEVNELGELVLMGTYTNTSNATYSSWTSRFMPSNVGVTAEWSAYSFTGSPFGNTANINVQGQVRIGGYSLLYGLAGIIGRVTVTTTGTGQSQLINSKTTNDLKGGAAKEGTVVIAGSGGTVIRSTDMGASFLGSAVSGAPDFVSVEGVGGGVWLLGASDGTVWISLDDGFTVTRSIPSGVTTPVRRIRNAGGAVVLSSNAAIRRSESQYSYDQNTQFLVPLVTVPSGFRSYVKAKEAA